jgi:ankyrin repeat protein
MTPSKENIQKFVQSEGNIPLMKKMLDDVTITDINIKFDNGLSTNTALMFETMYGTLEGMKFLLTHNPPADPNIKDKNGWTALHKISWAWEIDKETKVNQLAKLRLLLAYGADKSIKTNKGNTALDFAKSSFGCQKLCIKALESKTLLKNKTFRKRKPKRKTMRNKK